MTLSDLSLDLATLRARYAGRALRPGEVVAEVYRRIAARGDDHVWTCLVPREAALARARELEARGPDGLPLYGAPFSVKDNIHVAGLPTTAGCPAFSHLPAETATAVRRALEVGAILVGKNNMDQFATGLVGVRCAEGHCRNPFDERYIPGGSSSGSAVAVAVGEVAFSFGSDTGGSGRVPAALNNIVGLKATLGAISASGLVYCNRSFDCVPVFALTCDDAWDVFRAIRGHDPDDPYSRDDLTWSESQAAPERFRFGIPPAAELTFFGDAAAEAQFGHALAALHAIGGEAVEIDYAPFREATQTVFGGPLLAERLVDYGRLVAEHPGSVHPVVRQIIDGARDYSAEHAFREIYRVQALKQRARAALAEVDLLVCPTAGTIYRCDEVEADPVRLNSNMGHYTYFVNPLDLCALAVPAGRRPDGLPFGISLIGRAGQDALLWRIGRRFHAEVGGCMGATNIRLPGSAPAGDVKA